MRRPRSPIHTITIGSGRRSSSIHIRAGEIRTPTRERVPANYRLSLHFIEMPSEEYAVRRVALRVAAGGHSVPEADVRRRFHRGIALFQHVYKPLVDEWYHWHSDDAGLRLGDHDGK